jgi:putative ABC transport system permease protein
MVSFGSAWSKNTRRELRRTLSRFLAIFTIIALGVGFFVGLKAARPAMAAIGNDYLHETNLYDYQLLSTLGLTVEDVAYFADMDGVNHAEGSLSADLLTSRNGQQQVYKTHQLLQSLNGVQLKAGRMPQAPNECLGDALAFGQADLGTVLTVENDGETIFSQESYTLVGLCSSPQYLNIQRGTTSLGSGSVRGYLFIPAGGYEADYYTEIYLDLATGKDAFTRDYLDEMKLWEDPLTDALIQRGSLRRDSLLAEAQAELDKGQKEYDDALAEYQKAKTETEQQLADAKAQLEQAEIDLEAARQELADGEAQLRELENDLMSVPEMADARRKLDAGWAQYLDGKKQYEAGLAEFRAQQADAEAQLRQAEQELHAALQQLRSGEAQLKDGKQQLEQGKQLLELQLLPLKTAKNLAETELAQAQAELAAAEAELAQLDPLRNPVQYTLALTAVNAAKLEVGLRQTAYDAAVASYDAVAAPMLEQIAQGEAELAAGEAELEAGWAAYNEGLAAYEAGVNALQDGQAQLDKAKYQLDEAKRDLDAGEKQLADGYRDAIAQARQALDEGRAALADGETQTAQGWQDYYDGKAKADKEFADAEDQLKDARKQLTEARQQLADLKDPDCYALNRTTNTGYVAFDNDTSIVDGIARIFPIFFFLVAALVCSSTMTRMVEELRTENGTLKAMGYSDGRIMWRYAAYAGGAALLGSISGFFLCSWLFPYIIWHAYKILYNFGEIKLLLDWKMGAISLLCALLCSVGAACMAAWSEMRQMPAQLMRPKAPKAGKRVFLEYVTPIWKRMNFLHKVTVRNIFRYKKRLIMMILGVGGCMALLLAGLGLRDSISNVAEDQFTRITIHDYSITFRDELSDKEQQAFADRFGSDLDRCVFVAGQVMRALGNDGTIDDVNLIATDDTALRDLFRFRLNDADQGFPTDGAFISKKLSELAGVSVGDVLTVQTNDNRFVDVPVEAIFDNYVYHYVVVTGQTYEALFLEEPVYNQAYATTAQADKDAVAALLQSDESVVNVTPTSHFRAMLADTLTSMDAVIALVIGCAAVLAFVVSYNLCNINITERQREIATIKVLGFYANETHAYVFRESICLTIMGIAVGIPIGIWLHRFVVQQVQISIVAFRIHIAPLSYVLAVIISLAMIFVVEWTLRGKIDRVNMAESLKSVE